MDNRGVIERLIQLEQKLSQSQEEAYSLRKILEQFSAPAPSGDTADESNRRLLEMLNKRRKTFYKNDK